MNETTLFDAAAKTKNWYEPIPEVKCPPIGLVECIRAIHRPPMRKFDPEISKQLHGGEITLEDAHRRMDEKERPEKIIAEERQAKITAAIQKMPDQAHMQLMDVCCSGALPKEIPLNQEGRTLSKPYYRLTEAAELIGIAERDLLHYAIEGRLILLVPIPDQVKIAASLCGAHEMHYKKNVDQIFTTSIYPWRHEEFGKVTDLSPPNMLILSRLNCQKIDLHKEVMENCFESGYRIDGNNVFYTNPRSSNEYIKEVATSDSSQRFFVEKTAIWKIGEQNFQTGLKYSEENIRIKFDDLFVMSFNLKALIDSLPKEKAIETGNLTSPEEKPLIVEGYVNPLPPPLSLLAAEPSNSSTLMGKNTQSRLPKKNSPSKIKPPAGVLGPIIREAMKSALDSNDYQSVWLEIVKLAKMRPPLEPLAGYVEGEGAQWKPGDDPDDPDKIAYFTKDALRKRMVPSAR